MACEYPILVKDVPRADFYEIEVGRRGSLKYSIDQLRAMGWNVSFKLGGD